MDLRTIGSDLEAAEPLDRVTEPLARAMRAVPAPARRLLAGEWLGHPLHPMLTDLPIGFWTTAWLLDLVGGRRSARVATAMVGLGVATALPTAAAGLVDWAELSPEKRRPGVVHASANIAATALYGLSFAARVRGRRFRGVALGMAGAAAATAGGYLGGHLVFGTKAPSTPGQEGSPADGPGGAPGGDGHVSVGAPYSASS
jgi:uncharacterized membrane protein